MKILLDALKGKQTERVPFWYMRQAGRYLPEFAGLRRGGFLNMLLDPEIMMRASMLPLSYYDPDGLIIFSDLLIPLLRTGRMVNYENGLQIYDDEGSVDIYNRIASNTSKTLNALRRSDKTAIGFVGGPFTVASYLFDGRNIGYPETKRALLDGSMPGLIEPIIEAILDYAKMQSDNGAEVIQIFDSWIGSLSTELYRKYLDEIEQHFVDKIKGLGKPVIFFAEGASHLYDLIKEMNYDCISIDWRMTLAQYSKIDTTRPVQGNLDPYLLASDTASLIRETKRILTEGKKFPGHIFNLGHGVPQFADVSKLSIISDTVREYK